MIYQPSEDSFLLESVIKDYARGKKCLDVGTGSGILANECLKSKAKSVLAIDINPESGKFFKNFLQSDLFSNLSRKKFDLIIFNPPYLPQDKREDKESRIVTTGGKEGDEIILRFLKQSKEFLSPKGIILILFSSLTSRKKINNLLKKLNFSARKIAEKKVFFETLEVYEIKHNNQ